MAERKSAPHRSRRLRARPGAATGRLPQGTLEDVTRLVVGPGSVGAVLPEAISEAVDKRREALEASLEPVVTHTLWVVARRDSEMLGEVLSPTIGAAVRSAVSAAISALMERFNEALERSLSLRSVQWRIEARRTGRPFAEVVLLNTLVYRVEQVFLIHAPTGLVLQHVVAEGAPSADPDQVSAMLDALDTFSREAFETEPSGSRLSQFTVGDLKIWVDWGATLAVAAVVRGVAPPEFASLVRETRERIYLSHREDLAGFGADITPFATARPALEACLREQRRRAPRRAHIILAALGLILLAAIIGSVVRTGIRHAQEARQLAAYRHTLDAEPGLFVTTTERSGGRYRVVGLRDPLAASPQAVIERHGYPPAELDFHPFQSLDPHIVEKRARAALQPPPGVDLALEGSTLRLSGTAPRDWVARSLPLARALPGVAGVDAAGLRTNETALDDAIAELQASQINFALGSSVLTSPPQWAAVQRAARLVEHVRSLASELGYSACITVVGFTDSSGSPALNQALSQDRADAIVTALRSLGVDPAALRGLGGSVAGSAASHRAGSFEVRLQQPAGSVCPWRGAP